MTIKTIIKYIKSFIATFIMPSALGIFLLFETNKVTMAIGLILILMGIIIYIPWELGIEKEVTI